MQSSLVRHELWQLLCLALPAIVTSCSTMAMTATDQIIVGHLGRDALAAASIGNTWYNLMFYFQLGFSSAFDTQASQAFGAGDMHAVHACLLTALVLGVVAGLPMVAGLLATRPVAALLFQQPPAVAAQATRFCIRLVPGVIPQLLGLQLIKFLQAQNQMAAPAVLSAVAVLVNIGLNLLFVHHYGFLGAPLATTVSRLLFCVAAAALVIYDLLRAPRRAAPLQPRSSTSSVDEPLLPAHDRAAHAGSSDHSTQQLIDAGGSGGLPDRNMVCGAELASAAVGGHIGVIPTPQPKGPLLYEAEAAGGAAADAGGQGKMHVAVTEIVRRGMRRQALGSFLRLAIPGGLMVAMEMSSFDVTTAFAGLLGVVPIDAHVTLLTVITFNFISFPFGIAVAATIRVGNMLGAGRPESARAAGWCAIVLGAASMAVCAVSISTLRVPLAALFVDDAAVARMLFTILPLGAASEVFDGVMGTCQGVLRGAGKQVRILQYNLFGFWGVGVTTGAVLTFGLGRGLRGLWVGILCGICSTAVMNFCAFYRLDWAAEAAAARGTVDRNGGGSAAGSGGNGHCSEDEGVLNGQEHEAACAAAAERAADAALRCGDDVHVINEI
eukprot:jgi/Ulvmu1/11069/UM007_0251.1